MAHMLVAGLSTRGLGFLNFHRFWKISCKNKLFVVGRIHPATIREPRRKTPTGCTPLNSGPPQRFSLKCALSEPSPPSSSSDDAVLLSSKECPDGSILFMFGNPGQQVSEDLAEVAVDNGPVTNSEVKEIEAAQAGDNGFATNAHTLQDKVAVAASTKDTKLEAQIDSLGTNDGAVISEKEIEKVETMHAFVAQSDSMQSEKSAAERKGILRLYSGAAMRPHPNKVASGGEDAYIIEGDTWAGVADGVGGWALSGIDSGLYSRELMANCGLLAKLENGVPNPTKIIIKAVEKTKAVGTCTAVLATLHKQTLYVANLGDSGFLVVRNGNVLARSTPMQRGFNFPYQIGSEGDDPAMAEAFQVSVASGDVLVLATDGVYDNLYEREIVDTVEAGHNKGVEPGTVAMWLVKLAHNAGLNTEGRSPFSDAARAAGYSFQGGKLDDATVVVSYIK